MHSSRDSCFSIAGYLERGEAIIFYRLAGCFFPKTHGCGMLGRTLVRATQVAQLSHDPSWREEYHASSDLELVRAGVDVGLGLGHVR